MTRSEEELSVERVVRPRERVRLVKHVVTHSVTRTVEVRREQLRVEREPVAAGESGGTSAAGEQSLEIILHEEQARAQVTHRQPTFVQTEPGATGPYSRGRQLNEMARWSLS